MSDSDKELKKKIAESYDTNNYLLEQNAELLKKQTEIVKDIDDKVRKVVINTSD